MANYAQIKMSKSLKRFLSLVLVFTMITCSKSFFVFAESMDNDLKQESETVVEEVKNDDVEEVDEEKEETEVVDETNEEALAYEAENNGDDSEPEEDVEETTEKIDDEDVEETTDEKVESESAEDETSADEVVDETSEEETKDETLVDEDRELVGSAESGKGYTKNIPINYDLAGGEWDENADTTDEMGHPCLAPESTDEIEELAGGERFDFAIPTPRRDNYIFKGWRLNDYYALRYFIWEPEDFKHALNYMTLVSASFIHEDTLSEINLVADWEYRMDKIEYAKQDNEGYGYILINTELEKDFSKTDYVEYIDTLREQVISASRYLKDVIIKIDGVEVGKLVEDFGGRFNREDYVCNESFVYVFERELRNVNINYDLADGNWATLEGKKYEPTRVKAKSETFKLPELDKVEKDYYKFLGWKIDGEGDIVDTLGVSDDSEINVVAVFERSHSKITYDLDGGKWVNGVESNVVTKKELSETINLPGKEAVYKRGYKLTGWRLDGEGTVLTKFGTTNADAVLVAAWEEVELRKIEFASARDFWYAGASIDKEEIKSITFTTVAPKSYASSWEINGSDIVGYVTSNKDVYVYAKDDVQIVAYPVKNSAFYHFVSFFEGFTALEKIDNFGMVDGSELVTMAKMFKDCENLKEVDFEGFDASQVEDFTGTFMNTGFEELDLSMLDTKKVSMYQETFANCLNLRELYINIASKNYTYSALDMFLNCPELIAVFVPDDFEGSDVAGLFSHLRDEYNYSAKLNSSVKKIEREGYEGDKTIQVHAEMKVAADDNEGVLTAMSYAPANIGTITYDFKGEKVSFVNPENIYNEKLYGRQFYLPLAEEMSFNEELTFLGWYRDSECKDGPIETLLTDEKGDVTVYAKWLYPTIKWYTLDGGKELHLTLKSMPSGVVESGLDYYEEKQKFEDGILGYDVVEKIVIDDEMSFADKIKSSDAPFFGGFTKVKEIVGLSKVDFSNLKDFSTMFANCHSLESVDLTGVDTSNAETFEMMFANTYALKSVNFGNIDTSKVNDMSYMFAASGIESIDFKNVNTSKVTDMSFMFYDAKNLRDINMSSFNTLKVKEFMGMFKDCTALETLDLSSFALTYKEGMQSFNYMFGGCTNLVTIKATANFDLYKLKNENFYFSTNGMFDDCASLAGEKGTTVDLNAKSDYTYDYADIAHIDGYGYGTGYYKTEKPGVFSTKDTAIVIYRSIGNVQKEDVRIGYSIGDRITPYADLGANAVYNKYYADENKVVELTATAMRADRTRKVIYVEYYEPAVVKPVVNNNTVPTGRTGGSSSSGGSSSGSSGSDGYSSVGPNANVTTEQPVVTEVVNQTALPTETQEIAPNAVTNQESAKSASDTSFSVANDEATWEKNADGTWSLSVSVGNQNVTAANTFCTLVETNALTGQQTNAVYYFDEKGQMATGWVKDSTGNMYFFETANTADVGKMTTGWKSVNGSYYYFGADGKMMSNGVTPDGYYVGANGVWIA